MNTASSSACQFTTIEEDRGRDRIKEEEMMLKENRKYARKSAGFAYFKQTLTFVQYWWQLLWEAKQINNRYALCDSHKTMPQINGERRNVAKCSQEEEEEECHEPT